jgi:hypothetical protein
LVLSHFQFGAADEDFIFACVDEYKFGLSLDIAAAGSRVHLIYFDTLNLRGSTCAMEVNYRLKRWRAAWRDGEICSRKEESSNNAVALSSLARMPALARELIQSAAMHFIFSLQLCTLNSFSVAIIQIL